MMLSLPSQSSLKPWEAGSIIPWCQVRNLSSVNVTDLFSAMPGCEHRYVLLQICWLFFSSYSMKVSLAYQTESANMELSWKRKGHPATHLSRPSRAVKPREQSCRGQHQHPRQGWVETSQVCHLSCHSQPPPNELHRK